MGLVRAGLANQFTKAEKNWPGGEWVILPLAVCICAGLDVLMAYRLLEFGRGLRNSRGELERSKPTNCRVWILPGQRRRRAGSAHGQGA